MLQEIYVKNYALIDEARIVFEPTLNIITGETGAGKSIILGALGLILGKRAESSAFEGVEGKCIIEGSFQINNLGLEKLFEELDLDYENESILRREIATSGKSRAFINDSPVSLSDLKLVGEKLVDIHSQHSNLLIKDQNFRRQLLDYKANAENLAAAYKEQFTSFKATQKEFESLEKREQELREKAEFNRFQFEEIAQLNIEEGEYEQNEEELDRLNNAERIHEVFAQCVQMLSGLESSILNQLNETKSQLGRVSSLSKTIENLTERIASNTIDLQDVSNELESLIEDWAFDQSRLNYLNDRQSQLQRLFRKHGVANEAALLAKAAAFEKEIKQADNFDEALSGLRNQLANKGIKLQKTAKQVHSARAKSAEELNKKLSEMLRGLGIPDAQFSIKMLQLPFEEWNAQGPDRIDFLFTANKGKSPADVSKTASGGEISRIMLSMKALMANSNAFPTMIFDEIDLGVSGEVAIKMGNLIQGLAQQHQVVSITHLPQIAAMGNKHFRVAKKANKHKTISEIVALDELERIAEISEMIGGKEASESATASAKELLRKFAKH